MSSGPVLVSAGNPSLLQPESFLLSPASSYWWVGDRIGREGASDTHRLGKHRMLCCNHLTPASGTAREGAPSANTGDLTGIGTRKPNIPPAPRGAWVPSQPGLTWISVSSYMLSFLFSMGSQSAKPPFLPASWWFCFWCASLSQPVWAYNCNEPSLRKQFSLLEFLRSVR